MVLAYRELRLLRPRRLATLALCSPLHYPSVKQASRAPLTLRNPPMLSKFDKCEALYLACTLYHSGQWSEGYRLLCANPFRPGPLWSESALLKSMYRDSPDQWEYYKRVVRTLSL